jgi:hypothetical protein
MTRSNALGVLLAGVAAMALHSPVRADTSTLYELHAFTDVDGYRTVDKNISHTFFNVMDCIKFGNMLPPPPPSTSTLGHYITYGYTCVRVDSPGVSTNR